MKKEDGARVEGQDYRRWRKTKGACLRGRPLRAHLGSRTAEWRKKKEVEGCDTMALAAAGGLIEGMVGWLGGNLGLYGLLGLGPIHLCWASFYLFAVCSRGPASPDGDRFWLVKLPMGAKIIPSSSPNGRKPRRESGIGPRCHLESLGNSVILLHDICNFQASNIRFSVLQARTLSSSFD